MRLKPFAEPARVLFHLSEGYTKVLLERTEGVGQANGGIDWDIPTESIPQHLRHIGARFLLVGESIWPEEHDTAEELRAALGRVRVEELQGGRDSPKG